MNMNDAFLGSLIFNKDSGGGGGRLDPEIMGGYSKNLTTIDTLSHTFEEGGVYQYIGLNRLGDGGTLIDPVIKLNDTAITPNRYEYKAAYNVYYYGEVTVEADDVLTITNSMTAANSALQFFVFKNVDLNLFEVIGLTTNDNSTFPEPNNKWIFQVYQCGYYQQLNNFSYRLEKHCVANDSKGLNYQSSIATPAGWGANYYGFSYSILV